MAGLSWSQPLPIFLAPHKRGSGVAKDEAVRNADACHFGSVSERIILEDLDSLSDPAFHPPLPNNILDG